MARGKIWRSGGTIGSPGGHVVSYGMYGMVLAMGEARRGEARQGNSY